MCFGNYQYCTSDLSLTSKPLYHTDLQQQNGGRRRKKTNSSSRSRHSSHNYSIQDDDCVVDRVNGETFDIHQLENDAFLDGHDTTDSFSIEFASSSNEKLPFPKNGFHSDIIEDSASDSVVFKHSDLSQNQSQVSVNILVFALAFTTHIL